MPAFLLRALVAALAVLSAGSPAHGADASRPVIAIERVAVVDVARGAVGAPRTVLIAHGRIVAIEAPEAAAIPPDAVRVDGRGRYLIPGLVDMHVHLFNNASGRAPNDWAFPLFIANGVTAVRDTLTQPASMPTVERWRAEVASGERIAPRILAAGAAVRGDAEDTARRQVREISRAGGSFVKVFSETREPLWRAILDEARQRSLPVIGHVPAEIALLAAATAGQRTNEHLMQAYEACSADEARWLAPRRGLAGEEIARLRDAQERAVLESFDAGACERAAGALARTGQAQVPTLVLSYFEAHGDRLNYREDPRWFRLRPDEQARWQRILDTRTAEDRTLSALRWDVSRRIVAELHAARVPLLAGTDAPMPLVYPGYSLHDELARLVEAGLSPADALRAATLGPAELLGVGDDHGSVAVGKRADLVLLDADPLRDIGNARHVHAVVLDGRLLTRMDPDALLNPGAP
jgi:imidazolonepropionase-like amidohydrolase